MDPAYRTERLSLSRSRLRRAARISAGVAAGLVLAFGMLGFAAWRERWQLSGAGGVGGVAFGPGRQLLVSAVGGAGQDSMDTVWDVADPARPRQLSAFQGGEPTALSPDSRIVATVSFGGQPVLWNLADPGRPNRIAVMSAGGTAPLWGEAFSPDGQILAVAYTDRIFLWDVASAARPALTATISGIMAHALYPDGLLQYPDAPPCPSCSPANYAVAFTLDGRILTVVVARQEGNVTASAFTIATRDTVFTWNVTSSGTISGLTIATRDVNDSQPTLAPNGRTVADGSPTSNAVYLWTPP